MKSLSRFARNTLDALNSMTEKKLGVEFYFEKENISWSFQKNAQSVKVPLYKCIGFKITDDKKYV
ncbi:MAG: hypothetical protein ACLFRI_07980, partial [Candidatus Izemoplasmataceae bacterium]